MPRSSATPSVKASQALAGIENAEVKKVVIAILTEDSKNPAVQVLDFFRKAGLAVAEEVFSHVNAEIKERREAGSQPKRRGGRRKKSEDPGARTVTNPETQTTSEPSNTAEGD